MVWGVLWELNMEHLATLDDQESVHRGIYERIRVNVKPKDSANEIQVFSYQVRTEKLDLDMDRCKPSKVYKNVIIEGAIENGIESNYVEK